MIVVSVRLYPQLQLVHFNRNVGMIPQEHSHGSLHMPTPKHNICHKNYGAMLASQRTFNQENL